MNCQGNCASCGGCGGCGRSLELTSQELERLRSFGALPFQPVGRRIDDPAPICQEGPEESLVLQLLERKGLISLDYDLPLARCDWEEYGRLPVRGSAALTARGQEALDWIEYQGVAR